MRKKKILLWSNAPFMASGFGTFMRELLTYLWNTQKYDLSVYASGTTWECQEAKRWPFPIYGALPNDPVELQRLNQDPMKARNASYGEYNLDKVIREVKPDALVCIEDLWSFTYAIDRPWWNKMNCLAVWTSDSLPIFEDALNKATKIKHHYVWAGFAEREFHRLAGELEAKISKDIADFQKLQFQSAEQFQAAQNQFKALVKQNQEKVEAYKRVKTLDPCVNTSVFRKLPNYKKKELRKSFNIDDDCFCIGFISRNQLRKSIPNLVEGFKIFQQQNPTIKTKLLFFCHFGEGWNISKLAEEYKVNPEDILACYKCRATSEYFVMPFKGQDLDNPKTGHSKSLVTVNLGDKLTTEQLNEWFALLDCVVHPITSGGWEKTVQESKLCEIPVLANAYSCGETYCEKEAQTLVLDYAEYREFGTQFIKASVYPSSIAKQLKKLYDTPIEKREEMGRLARQWVLNRFSIEKVGKNWESILDNLPEVEYDLDEKFEPKDPNAEIIDMVDDKEFVKQCYGKILKMFPEDQDSGLLYWLNYLGQQQDKAQLKQQLVAFFRETAAKDNAEKGAGTVKLEDLLIKNNKKQCLLVAVQSIGDLLYVSALLESFRKSYPPESHNIYLACEPQYFEIFDGNTNIDKLLPYDPSMSQEISMTGCGANKGLFDVFSLITSPTQFVLNYLTNNNIPLLSTSCS